MSGDKVDPEDVAARGPQRVEDTGEDGDGEEEVVEEEESSSSEEVEGDSESGGS